MSVENRLVDPEFTVPRMERAAGGGFQSRSSAGSPGASASEKSSGTPARIRTVGRTTTPDSPRSIGRTSKDDEPEPRPMEPSRVIEVQFFKDGFLGKKLTAESDQGNGRIDIEA